MTLREAGELYDDTVQKISQVTSNERILAEAAGLDKRNIYLDDLSSSTIEIRREIVLSIVEQLYEYRKTLNRYLDTKQV